MARLKFKQITVEDGSEIRDKMSMSQKVPPKTSFTEVDFKEVADAVERVRYNADPTRVGRLEFTPPLLSDARKESLITDIFIRNAPVQTYNRLTRVLDDRRIYLEEIKYLKELWVDCDTTNTYINVQAEYNRLSAKRWVPPEEAVKRSYDAVQKRLSEKPEPKKEVKSGNILSLVKGTLLKKFKKTPEPDNEVEIHQTTCEKCNGLIFYTDNPSCHRCHQ